MDANAITTLIGSVGFPIVMCLIMVKVVMTMEESHKEEINSLKESFNANTQVLTRLETMFNTWISKQNGGEDKE